MDGTHLVHIADRAHETLDASAALEFVSDPGFGGVAIFVGRVRDLNHGRRVTGISYDLYRPLALARFEAIAQELKRQFGSRLKLYIAHTMGRLDIGDLAVVVAAGTPHRDEAFRACRAAIEAVKHTAPIWKQEHYVDGDSSWSEGCSLCDAAPAGEVSAGTVEHNHADAQGGAAR